MINTSTLQSIAKGELQKAIMRQLIEDITNEPKNGPSLLLLAFRSGMIKLEPSMSI